MSSDQNNFILNRDKRKSRNTVIGILVTAIIIVGAITLGIIIDFPSDSDFEEVKPYYFIKIKNNQNFTDYGFSGNGSIHNPFIIENLTISDYEYAIIIYETSACFEIRNCTFNNNIFAMDISYISSDYFVIYNCTIKTQGGYYSGIDYSSSWGNVVKNISILENTFDSKGGAVHISGYRHSSSNLTIANNLFTDGSIHVGSSINAKIFNNTFDESNISFFSRTSVFLENNTLEIGLIQLWDCRFAVIKNNYLAKGGIIIQEMTLEKLDSCQIENNYINNKKIVFLKHKNNTEFVNVDYGEIILLNCTNVVLKDNCFENASASIVILHCTNITVMNTSISRPIYTGILICYSKFCKIVNNSIEHSKNYGITLYFVNDTLIVDNLFRDNNYKAITAFSSYRCLIYSNHFINNSHSYSQASDSHGQNFWYNPETKKGNYWSDWSGIGYYRIWNYDENNRDLYPLRNSPYGKRKK
ncbi:MAG: NosD domain-containing protein, partial [Candidatus Heimdallarchaeaceae archaeon]